MVISQIAGLATAFGTGELSGAGFGPNYTILMKLGYEFFAPRILEEMEKNPNVFFQDTLWFKKFQKQIKLYSDAVMKETLDTLLQIPQDTIDKIADRFRERGSEALPSFPGAPNVPVTAIPALNQILTIIKLLEQLIARPMTFNVIVGSGAQLAEGLSGGNEQSIPAQPLRPQDVTDTIIPDAPSDQPPAPALNQEQLFQKYKNDYFLYRQKGGWLTQSQFDARNLSATSVRQYLQQKHPVPTGATTTFAKNSRRTGQSVKLEVSKKQNDITARTKLINQYFAQQGNTIPPPRYVIGLWTSRNTIILALFNLWWVYQGFDAPHV